MPRTVDSLGYFYCIVYPVLNSRFHINLINLVTLLSFYAISKPPYFGRKCSFIKMGNSIFGTNGANTRLFIPSAI